jgi:hypothetical protein
MTAGSAAGTVLLAALSTVHTVVGLYAVWIGIGVASAMAFYEAAFAVVVAWHSNARARANALLAVTVVAGFASSIFLPLTGALVDRYGWRFDHRRVGSRSVALGRRPDACAGQRRRSCCSRGDSRRLVPVLLHDQGPRLLRRNGEYRGGRRRRDRLG